ncbi:MAG TPA: FliM/FliN family flagellar motor switch protein [bacterium]|nr:FliM/FliN family flagellar motor switch protein [bacterium]HPN43180.1 FliM/FliN family flagellar motor switch protein [bacterium]
MRKNIKVSLYDFRHPRRLTKEQRSALSLVYEAYAKLLGAYFTTLLRTLTDVQLVRIDESMFGDFIGSRTEPDGLCIFTTNKSDQPGIFELPPEFIFLIIDRLFGGQSLPKFLNRPNTAIEKNIITRVLDRMLQMLDRAWYNMLAVESTVKSFETNPYMAQVVGRSEPTILVIYDVTLQKDRYQINICLPIPMMGPFFKAIKEWTISIKTQEAAIYQREQMQETVLRTEFPFVVKLGKAKLKLQELLDLEVGDVLLLNQWVQKPLDIAVDDAVKFRGIPGIRNNRKSIKITQIVKSIAQ